MCKLLNAVLDQKTDQRPRWTFHGIILCALKLSIVLVCLNELLYCLSFEEVRSVVY